MYYSSFGVLAVVVTLIINLQALGKPSDDEETPVHKRYRQFLWSFVLFCFADIIWGTVYELRIRFFAYFDTALFFITMGLTVVTWMRFIVSFLNRRSIFSRFLTLAGVGVFAFQILALLVNLFIPIVFYFDEKSEYFPKQGRYFMLSIQVLLFGALAVYPFIRAYFVKRKERLRYFAVGLSGITMTMFVILQMLYPFLPFYSVGCLLSTCIIHTFVELDEKEEYDREIGSFKRMAYKDPLTNVKSSTAYNESKSVYDDLIKAGSLKDFGVVVFDVNNLKYINDTQGHEAGDRYIRQGSRLICNTFKHSPVYRIGGDEFAVFLEGDDYRERGVLMTLFNDKVENNMKCNGVIVSAGMSIFDAERDRNFDDLFKRADYKMYERKRYLKSKDS